MMAKRNLVVRTSPSPRARDEDWDAEARTLLRRVNVQRDDERESYRHVDCIYRHPTTHAKLFVGNLTAARNVRLLEAENIFRVVNTQDVSSANFFEDDARFAYRRFPVAPWREAPAMGTAAGVLRFFEEGCHAWIAEQLQAGNNVLVHCLAGAHRAGTTGVSFMMREGRFTVETAIRLAKSLRPVIDPIGSLRDLLERLARAYVAAGNPALPVSAGGWARAVDDELPPS